MFNKSLIALCIIGLSGCSAVSTYDSIADNVSYTYDQDLKQSVVKGPIDSVPYNSKANVESLSYQLSVLHTDLIAEIKVSYSGDEIRGFNKLADSTGRQYNVFNYDKTITNCGIIGSFRTGICDFTESFAFKLPREDRYHYVALARNGDHVAFEMKRNYIAVMNDVVYKLKTPRADYDEQRIKKDALVAAKPVEVKKPSLQSVPPLKPAPIQPPKPLKPAPAPIVKAVPVQQPLFTSPIPEAKNCTTKLVETCTPVKKEKKVAKPVVAKKVEVTKTVKSNTPVILTPTKEGNLCSGLKFKSCAAISSCREAYDQLACGNRKVDPDKNGIPCQAICRTPFDKELDKKLKYNK